MDFIEDYGDIRHKHSHIHSKPEKHQQTINTALKDWCLEIFEEEGEEKCRDLNQNFFDTLITGSVDEINLSKIYKIINNLSKINKDISDYKLKVSIEGTQLVLEINNKLFKKEIFITEEKELMTIFSLNKNDLKGSGLEGVDEKSHNSLLIIKIKEGKLQINDMTPLDLETYGHINSLKTELSKINLDEILNENRDKIDIIRKKKDEIDRIKLIQSDNLTPKRRLQYLEKWDQDIFKELIGLIGYLIIGICFGIYCIYNFFVLQLK